MKSLILSLLLATTVQVSAATVELGKYRAVDAATKSTVADFELKANGMVNFRVRNPDFAVSCSGKYAIRGNQFAANLQCNSFFLSETSVRIDIRNVNPQSLRSEKGALVDVIIDALSDEPVKYLLKKVN